MKSGVSEETRMAFERGARILARRRLIYFASYVMAAYVPSCFHFQIAETLERIEAGELDRVILSVPPRHGKTLLAVIDFAAWFLGRHPEKSIIYATYAASLSTSKSRLCRNLMESDEYKAIFPDVRVDQSHRSVVEWSLEKYGGGFRALGVGGGITGHGADGLIIDDPIKNMEEAESAVYREKVWSWYTSTARTRLEPKGFILLIMARWNLDDLAGRLLEAEKTDPEADRWTVINYPAISEDRALWPERFPMENLLRTKASISAKRGGRYWDSLYQGEPRQREGAIFKREWFVGKIIDEIPAGRKVRSWDLAASKETSADSTVGAKCSMDGDVLVVEHVVSGQWEWPEAKRIIKEMAREDGDTVEIGVEQVGMQLALVQELKEELEKDGFRVIGVPVDRDKYARALPLVAKAEAGYLKLVRGAWNLGFVDVFTNFTGRGTERDDEVDAVGQAHIMLKGEESESAKDVWLSPQRRESYKEF